MIAKAKMFRTLARQLVGLLCILLLVPGDTPFYAQQQQPGQQASAPKIPPDQLDSLVAPIALYPDPLLAQTLAASTYPLEIIELQQWLQKTPGLKDKALADAVEKQQWDPSVQALAPMPDLVKRLADDLQWTTDLGNAFLAQQSDVMAAVQRMRKKAESKGNLKTSDQQKVETQVIEGQQTIVIQPSSPQVIYVPTYNPTVVYGPPVYPYPPIYYPPPGYYAAGLAISFGIGVAMGAFWSGGWGWGCGWGHSNVYINHNNTFIRNSNININGGNRPSQLPNRGGAGGAGGIGGPGGAGGNRPGQLPAGDSSWQHNPAHRGGAPYGDRTTADRFGGATRGDSLANRQAGARQQISRQGGNLPSNRAGAGVGNRASGIGGGGGGLGGGGGVNRAGAGGGADRIAGRDLSRSGGGNRDAFGGGDRNFSGTSARANSARGASSFGGGGGGGGARAGGGRRK
jgi:hypothetical protein